MKLSNQAVGALLMTLQKCLAEQTDITERMTQGLAAITDPLARYNELETREKTVLKEAESDPSLRAEVRSREAAAAAEA